MEKLSAVIRFQEFCRGRARDGEDRRREMNLCKEESEEMVSVARQISLKLEE